MIYQVIGPQPKTQLLFYLIHIFRMFQPSFWPFLQDSLHFSCNCSSLQISKQPIPVKITQNIVVCNIIQYMESLQNSRNSPIDQHQSESLSQSELDFLLPIIFQDQLSQIVWDAQGMAIRRWEDVAEVLQDVTTPEKMITAFISLRKYIELIEGNRRLQKKFIERFDLMAFIQQSSNFRSDQVIIQALRVVNSSVAIQKKSMPVYKLLFRTNFGSIFGMFQKVFKIPQRRVISLALNTIYLLVDHNNQKMIENLAWRNPLVLGQIIISRHNFTGAYIDFKQLICRVLQICSARLIIIDEIVLQAILNFTILCFEGDTTFKNAGNHIVERLNQYLIIADQRLKLKSVNLLLRILNQTKPFLSTFLDLLTWSLEKISVVASKISIEQISYLIDLYRNPLLRYQPQIVKIALFLCKRVSSLSVPCFDELKKLLQNIMKIQIWDLQHYPLLLQLYNEMILHSPTFISPDHYPSALVHLGQIYNLTSYKNRKLISSLITLIFITHSAQNGQLLAKFSGEAKERQLRKLLKRFEKKFVDEMVIKILAPTQ